MNKFFKSLFLSATLLIPVAIFLFLKFFGDNRFDIPVYYQTAVKTPFEGCEPMGTGQYRVQQVSEAELPGVYFFLSDRRELSNVKNIQNRVGEAVSDFNTIVYSADTTLKESADVKYLDEAEFKTRMRCNFVTDTVDQFVLVDSERRIRGYYNTERDEIDRLIVEVKILLENEASK